MSGCLLSVEVDCVVKSLVRLGLDPDGGVAPADSPGFQGGGGVLGRTVLKGGDVGDVVLVQSYIDKEVKSYCSIFCIMDCIHAEIKVDKNLLI